MADSIPPVLPARSAWSTAELRHHLGWRDIAAAVSGGLIIHPSRGAYHDPSADLACRLQALETSVGQTLVACHATAARLHGFGVVDDGLLHVTTPDGRSLRQRPGIKIHQHVPVMPLVQRHGALLMDPAETAIDVVRSVAEIDILPVLDAALRSGVCRSDLANATELARRRRGIVGVRRWLDQADPLAESAMESRTRFRVLEAGLPIPTLQLVVPVSGGGVRRLDLGWRERRVGLEYDGQDFHSGDGSLARDRRRHNQLTDAGWTVLYATASDVYRDPGPLIAQLRRLLM